MRLPWTRRGDDARDDRVKAELKLQQVRADWPRINQEVAVTRRERELNGWTRTVQTLFSGRHPQREPPN